MIFGLAIQKLVSKSHRKLRHSTEGSWVARSTLVTVQHRSRASLSACSHKQRKPALQQGASGARSRHHRISVVRVRSITCRSTRISPTASPSVSEASSLEQGSCARACWPCVSAAASRSPPLLHPTTRALCHPRQPPCARNSHWHAASCQCLTSAQHGAE